MTELSREEVLNVEKTDHPDLVGGIVWADCELNWIRSYGVRCHEAGAKSERAVSDRLLEALKTADALFYGHGLPVDPAITTAIAEVEAMRMQPEEACCKSCGGNDGDAPCAYPSEGKHGCLRDTRLAASMRKEKPE